MGEVNMIFDGYLGWPYFCAKSCGKYCLYRRSRDRNPGPAIDQIIGSNTNLGGNGPNQFKKGEFYELRLGYYRELPIFKKGAKVLCLKNIGNSKFTREFFPGKIVEGPILCERKYKKGSVNEGVVRPGGDRHYYYVDFDDGDKKQLIYEEFVIPRECDWGKDKMKYTADSDTSSSSESSSDDSESDTSSSSSSEEEKSKHKKKHSDHHHHDKKRKHNHAKKEKRHHHHSRQSPNVVIIPIFIPYY